MSNSSISIPSCVLGIKKSFLSVKCIVRNMCRGIVSKVGMAIIFVFGDTIIFKWFKEKYCEVCPDIEIIYHGKNDLWKECYFEGVCPHQDWDERLIKLWLNAEI